MLLLSELRLELRGSLWLLVVRSAVGGRPLDDTVDAVADNDFGADSVDDKHFGADDHDTRRREGVIVADHELDSPTGAVPPAAANAARAQVDLVHTADPNCSFNNNQSTRFVLSTSCCTT